MKEISQTQLNCIVETLKKLEFGQIVVTVHNGKITQIESTEKIRFVESK